MKIVVIGGTGLIGSKHRRHFAPARQLRGRRRLTPKRYQHHHRAQGALAGAQVIDPRHLFIHRQGGAGILQTSGRNLRSGGRSGRPAPCRAIHCRNRPVARQWLFPRQGRPGETDRDLRHPLHHHPRDSIPGIPRRHRRFRRGWKYGQGFTRPVPAHRGGRCRSACRRDRAGGAAKQHHRNRRPRARAIQRDRRPLSEGGRRGRRELLRDAGRTRHGSAAANASETEPAKLLAVFVVDTSETRC